MRLFRTAALPLALAALALAGCSGEQGGTAQPMPMPSGQPSATPTESSGSEPSSGTGATSAIKDPCSLASSADLGAVAAFGEGTAKDVAGARGCEWKTGSGDLVTFSVSIWDAQGLADVKDVGGGKATGKVGARAAVQQKDGAEGCVIALGVGEKARVDLNVTADTTDPCAAASKIAEIVEPKLPKG